MESTCRTAGSRESMDRATTFEIAQSSCRRHLVTPATSRVVSRVLCSCLVAVVALFPSTSLLFFVAHCSCCCKESVAGSYMFEASVEELLAPFPVPGGTGSTQGSMLSALLPCWDDAAGLETKALYALSCSILSRCSTARPRAVSCSLDETCFSLEMCFFPEFVLLVPLHREVASPREINKALSFRYSW